MGDVHIPKEDPTKVQRVGARVQELIDSGHQFYAATLTGDPAGRVRRPTLFIVAIIATGVGAFAPPALVVSLIAILMLALTDQVVEL